MRTSKTTRCASCGRRFREHQPDLILGNVSGGRKPRFYHAHCKGAAYARVMERPSAYLLTVRHADPSAN